MNITIVGGGNIGTEFAVHCAEKDHLVTIFTSKPEKFQKRLIIVDDNDNIIHEGTIAEATSDPAKAFSDADVIFVTVPAMCMDETAETIYAHCRKDARIGVVPGNGGSECAFSKCIMQGNLFFGIERVPSIARLIEYGKVVRCNGYRDELHVSAIPRNKVDVCCELVGSLFDMPCKQIPCFLNLTMTPSNPILHTSRLRILFNDWKPGVYYQTVPLFYEEWNDESSQLLLAMDDEVQEICHNIPELDLRFVKSLRLHYESPDVRTMTKKISSIIAFKGIKTPTKQMKEGLIPDLNSRYFTADFNYGLSIIQQIGDIAGVQTPNIDDTMEWYGNIATHGDIFDYRRYGIVSNEEFIKFYNR
jgi:opine dehydrogenase